MPNSSFMDSLKSSRNTGAPQSRKSKTSSEIKTAVGVLAGAWALKNYPKATVIGLIGVGILIGMTIKEVARSVDAFPRRREHLH